MMHGKHEEKKMKKKRSVREMIAMKTKKLIAEGYSDNQATAIANDMIRRKHGK